MPALIYLLITYLIFIFGLAYLYNLIYDIDNKY